MLDGLSIAAFAPLVGQAFTTAGHGPSVELALVSAQALGAAPSGHREPFSLVFRGPIAPLLQQRTYALLHEALGTLEIFIVPIGPDRQGQLYEAIFA
jgi:hypothetical protein